MGATSPALLNLERTLTAEDAEDAEENKDEKKKTGISNRCNSS